MTTALRLGIKRAGDVMVSGILLVALLPVLFGVGLAIALTMGRPVLFRQVRPGRDGHPFEMVKFRTMRDPRLGEAVNSTARITRLGKVLRATSLDELPELYNVLRGDMSIVGPRPLLMKYLPRYTAEEFRRHAMRPGVTGLAQVSGRNLQTWEDRLAADVRYVDSWSLLLDLKILIATVRTVLSREGVDTSAQGRVTMSEFRPDHRA